jgi:hypothetical protein
MAEVSANVLAQQVASQASIDALLQALQPALTELGEIIVTDFVPSSLDTTTPTLEEDFAAQVTAAASAVQPLVFSAFASAIPIPDKVLIDDLTVVTLGSPPEFTLVEPVVDLPPKPLIELPDAPDSAPEFIAPTIPEQAFVFPDAPTFASIDIPVIPDTVIPVFDGIAPDDEELLAPSNNFSYTEAEYQSILLDPLRQKLLNDLLFGGYGIDDADEMRLFNRAMEREVLAGEMAVQEATRAAAGRGFALPPGAMLAMIESAQQAALAKISSASRDITIKKADMYVENRKFTITETREVEDMSWKYWSFAQERILNAAKYAAEFAMQFFNVQLERYKTKIETYKIRADVYDTLVKAALANLEAYKVKMEGTRLTVEVQKLHAEVYRSQLAGVEALAGIYKTRMDAARVHAEIEQLKLSAFRAEVEAYTALVGAKAAEVQLYKAEIDGEMSKVEIYRASVGAYNARVDAFRTIAAAAASEMDMKVKAEGLKVDVYRADIDRYKGALQAAQTDIQAMSEKYSNDIRRYVATVEGFNRSADAHATVGKANADIALAKAGVISGHVKAQNAALTEHAKMITEASRGSSAILVGAINGFAAQTSGIVASIENAG